MALAQVSSRWPKDQACRCVLLAYERGGGLATHRVKSHHSTGTRRFLSSQITKKLFGGLYKRFVEP